MANGKGKPSNCATAAAEHISAIGADVVHDLSKIISLDLWRNGERRVLDCAFAYSMGVVRHYHVIFGQQVCELREPSASHRLTNYQQQRTGATNFVVNAPAGDVHVVLARLHAHEDLHK
jgi:hypothetical protein